MMPSERPGQNLPTSSAEAQTDVVSDKYFRRLPPELVEKILSNLSHGDQLWARLVCRQWDELVRKDPKFLEKSIICVCVATNPDTILKDTIVKWTHLCLKDVRASVSVPQLLQGTVLSLKISNGSMDWTEFQEILVQFPKLQELKFSRIETTPEPRRNWKSTSEYEAVLSQIKSLKISRSSFESSTYILTRLLGNLPMLTSFNFNIHEYCSPLKIVKFIEGVCPTLKNLCVSIGDSTDGHLMTITFFKRVLKRLNESDVVKNSLNLDSICLRYPTVVETFSRNHNQIILEFLKINKNMKKICALPRTNSTMTAEMAREVILALPKNLVELEIPSPIYFLVQPNLLQSFNHLSIIKLWGEFTSSDLNLDGQIFPCVKVLENCTVRDTNELISIDGAFPNIVHLKIRIARHRSDRSENMCHWISLSMRRLVSLNMDFDITDVRGISDFDICGVTSEYLSKYQRSPLESWNEIQVPSEHVLGSLSSMPRLEEFVIRSQCMDISDVGLYLGFQMPRLKKISLTSVKCHEFHKITAEGLMLFGANNKNLEKINFHNIVHRVNTSAFEREMTRCKSFRMSITCDEESCMDTWISDHESN